MLRSRSVLNLFSPYWPWHSMPRGGVRGAPDADGDDRSADGPDPAQRGAAKIIVRASHAGGTPAENARVTVSLDLPPRNAFFSTGFPSPKARAAAARGGLAPHGGAVLHAPAHARSLPLDRQRRTARRPGNARRDGRDDRRPRGPGVVRNFVLLLCLLAGFGLVSGVVLGRAALKNASRAVAAVALALLLHPCAARAHDRNAQANATPAATTQPRRRGDAFRRPHRRTTRPRICHGRTDGRAEGLLHPRRECRPAHPEFTLSFTNLDHDKEIFAPRFFPTTERSSCNTSLPTASTISSCSPPKPPTLPRSPVVEAEMTIAVRAIHPPKIIVYRTLAFLVGIAALAMAVGYVATVRLGKGRAA